MCALCIKTSFVLPFTLANESTERDIRRAYIVYDPLYPSFQESLNRFRQGENAELFQRGAEQMVHNVGLYDTRRSSEDRIGDLSAPRQEDTATPGPTETVADAEDGRVEVPRQDGHRGHRDGDNNQGSEAEVRRRISQQKAVSSQRNSGSKSTKNRSKPTTTQPVKYPVLPLET